MLPCNMVVAESAVVETIGQGFAEVFFHGRPSVVSCLLCSVLVWSSVSASLDARIGDKIVTFFSFF